MGFFTEHQYSKWEEMGYFDELPLSDQEKITYLEQENKKLREDYKILYDKYSSLIKTLINSKEYMKLRLKGKL